MKIIFVMFFVLCFIKTGAQTPDEFINLKSIIKNEIKKHPEMEIGDVYKLLHQAAMGSEHAVKNEASAREWMENEIAGLNLNREENLIDTISPGGKIVRVNLRPYVKAGFDIESLLTAFIKTANNFTGSIPVLENYLKIFLKMIEESEVNYSKEEAKKFFEDLKNKKYPAIHHSKKYEEKYLPAYRVVAEKYSCYLKKD